MRLWLMCDVFVCWCVEGCVLLSFVMFECLNFCGWLILYWCVYWIVWYFWLMKICDKLFCIECLGDVWMMMCLWCVNVEWIWGVRLMCVWWFVWVMLILNSVWKLEMDVYGVILKVMVVMGLMWECEEFLGWFRVELNVLSEEYLKMRD